MLNASRVQLISIAIHSADCPRLNSLFHAVYQLPFTALTALDKVILETTQLRGNKQTKKYLVIVDAKGEEGGSDGQEGNFRLEVQCNQR